MNWSMIVKMILSLIPVIAPFFVKQCDTAKKVAADANAGAKLAEEKAALAIEALKQAKQLTEYIVQMVADCKITPEEVAGAIKEATDVYGAVQNMVSQKT